MRGIVVMPTVSVVLESHEIAWVGLHHVGLEPLQGSNGFCHERVYDCCFESQQTDIVLSFA